MSSHRELLDRLHRTRKNSLSGPHNNGLIFPFGKKAGRSLIKTCTMILALIIGTKRNVGDVIQRVAAEMQAAPPAEVAKEAVKGDVVVASGGFGG